MAEPDLVIVGRIRGAHGVAGLVHLISSTEPPDNIERYRPWWLGDTAGYRRVEVRSLQPHRNGYLARLEGVDDREQAQALAGRLIAVPRSALPALEPHREYYWQDLIGLSVVEAGGGELGRVRELMATGAHDVLVIDGGERDVLIPFVEAFVLEVDLAQGVIRVAWQAPA